ncbi:PilZ domain-containing protein [Paenibacillus sp. WQ 127069]|uniref:PilZ domain-containing protein n=1 Tax=Paenibacillus baimaensis TaxID=2982185 RepID=A0ABT2UU85_9BACL|nr:PilZ domain-containing protein [Paenibacillus sp. WQ 127069]MCU6798230.1 PilZ domain-containing protein [Paenibacillus sp. WQ 127069]
MAASRRKEPLRYQFAENIESPFTIIEINGMEMNSKDVGARLVDLSQNGCQIESFLNLKAADNDINITVKFTLLNQHIEITGHINWQRSTTYCHYYGIEFVKSSVGDYAFIMQYLKSYSRSKSQSIAT